jgi:cell filamentation protein
MTEDPYLIPGTEVLRNIPGLTNTAQLEEFEANMAAARVAQLETVAVKIPGNCDLDHLLAHHRHVFQDVYSWAGVPRTVSISKPGTTFCEPRWIESSAATIFQDLAQANRLQGLERPEFVAGAAHVLTEINVLHPVREGNGRAQRSFMGTLARQAGWQLDWSRVDPARNIEASIAGYRGDERPMAELLDDITSRLPPGWGTESSGSPPGRSPTPSRGRGSIGRPAGISGALPRLPRSRPGRNNPGFGR